MSMMRLERLSLVCLLLTVLAAACAGRSGHAVVGDAVDGRPMPADPEERLSWALADTRAPDRLAALGELERSLRNFDARLARLVADTAVHPVIRANAVVLLAERRAREQLLAFWTALEAKDVRVRAAAAGTLGAVFQADEQAGARLARRALRDPDRDVQARALEAIADNDVELLREYVAQGPPAEFARVATDLIRIAEERGAPLAPAGGAPDGLHGTGATKAADGDAPLVLARVAASGPRLEFRAFKRWPQWDAAVGELVVARADGAPIVVADEVEVVGGVVPAFFSVDGRHIVYEAAREIRVRDLDGGEERVVGEGIAPRVVPFSSWFVFLRELPEKRAQDGEAMIVHYEVLRGSFDDGEVESIGAVTATLSPSHRGFYSPARWMRVRERDGIFWLEGEYFSDFRLPDPFSAPEGGA